jgi:O-antigen ligase
MQQIVFSLLLVLLPTQLGYHFWPNWALVLGRRIDYLSPTLYLTDILVLLLLVSWGISQYKKFSFFLHRRQAGIFHFSFKQKHFQLAIVKLLLISGTVVLNIYFAANRMVALFAWIKILELVALGAYIVKTKPKFENVIFFLSIGMLYSSLIAIIQFLLQHTIGGMFWFLGERTFSAATPGIAQISVCFPDRLNCPLMLRAYATFPHPNVLGGFLAITLPLVVVQVKDKKKLLYIPTLVLGLIALVVTFSRSAWTVAILSSVYLVFRRKKRMFFPIAVSAIIVLLFIGKTFGFQDESIVVREQLNAAAVAMFRASPLFGTGLGNFLVRLPDYLVSRTVYFLQPVHNIYLLLLSETGIIGCSVFLWVLWKAEKNIFRKFSMYHLSLFTVLVLGLADHYFLTLQQGQLLCTIFLSLSLIQ